MAQYIIVFTILILAVIWAVHRIRTTFKESKGGCYGCKGCAFKEQIMKNMNKNGKRPHCYNKN